MADYICRALRDGVLDGEYAPALSIKDSLQSAFGLDVFNYFLYTLASNISVRKSQSQALVLVALHRSPSFYIELLKHRSIDYASCYKWFRILDCYSDPLGWNSLIKTSPNVSLESEDSIFTNVTDIHKMFSSIYNLGKGVVGQGKVRFSVAIDSVSTLLRHTSLPSVAALINNLRSSEQVSCVFWSVHSDLHDLKVIASLEYLSTMVASIKPKTECTNVQRGNLDSWSLVRQNCNRGNIESRLKRRNGRVKVINEEFYLDQSSIKFSAFSYENTIVTHDLLPKVQFNLKLSEKEREDREKVVLPFEHQENVKATQIYDGRRSPSGNQIDHYPTKHVSAYEMMSSHVDIGKGEIHYIRDSDEEQLDSDEDPDDDLDI